MATTQNEQVLALLTARGPIGLTPLEAQEAPLRCFRLAARIDDLRHAGHAIETHLVSLPGRRRFARYVLTRGRR